MLRSVLLALWLPFLWCPQAPAAEMIDLEVSGYQRAVVLVPEGGGPRPVLLATHGSYDRPEWQCESWKEIIGDGAFVLCPRGVLRWDSPEEADHKRFYYRSNEQLEREIEAGLAALRKRFSTRVADGPVVYTGFSQGAIMGLPILLRSRRYPRAVLVEGGYGWTAQAARTFAQGGGKRVLFSCGRPSCMQAARAAAAHLERAGVLTRVVLGQGGGHDYRGVVERQTRAGLSWLLEGDPRFAVR